MLQKPEMQARMGHMNARELMTHAIESQRKIFELQRAVPALQVLEARTAAIGRTAQRLEARLLAFDDEASVRAAARARYVPPVPPDVQAALTHGPAAPRPPRSWIASDWRDVGYRIPRKRRRGGR